MLRDLISSRRLHISVLPLLSFLLVTACSKQTATPPNPQEAKQQTATPPPVAPDGLPATSSDIVSLPMGFTRDTSDLDGMVKRRQIRALDHP